MPRIDYKVSIPNRLEELMLNVEVGPGDTVIYEWRGGYEVLKTQAAGSGKFEYRGSYHPGDGGCEGNPCHYCGYTRMGD